MTANHGLEKELILLLKRGCNKAFRALFSNYHKKIYNLSRNMGLLHEDAEGIVQDVFLQIWENREKLNENFSFNALLFTITKRIIFKKIRKKIYAAAYKNYITHVHKNLNNNTEDEIIYSDLNKYVQNGINQLAPIRKEIFTLSKQQGLTNDGIAQKLNISKRTVENHLYRAIKQIKKFLKVEDI